MNHRNLVMATKDTLSTVTWLYNNNYITQNFSCQRCSKQMNTIINKKKQTFRCNKCKNEISLYTGSIFYNSKIKIYHCLDLMYFWSVDLLQFHSKKEIETSSPNTVNNWYLKMQKLSYAILKFGMRSKIGGLNRIVQIDECLFSRRKYNIGRLTKKKWIVGGIDYMTNEVFFVETFSRSSQALNEIILNNVEKGSIIYTDGWAGYNGLQELGFTHFVVNHKRNFVNSETGVNTQKIEGTWSVMKRWLRRRGISNRNSLFFYFIEFCFKRKFKGEVFEKLLSYSKYFERLVNN